MFFHDFISLVVFLLLYLPTTSYLHIMAMSSLIFELELYSLLLHNLSAVVINVIYH